ncbi:MAG: UDP-N-acetylglucosamine 1-carboxyvinyltransferase [Firmicutes bacterium]|nr:UDP-N-acetylglucosamine 1-carboxyvinyltransferase [Bacillota bacterium]
MRQYRIRGGNRIAGQLCVGGAKNAALPILAAVCLNESVNEIHNCPPIADTFASIEILKSIGCKIDIEGTTLKVDSSGVLSPDIPGEIVGKMRSSILFMGAMLGRCGKVNIAMPGGCKLGARAIDLHISGLAAMGAVICINGDKLRCEAKELKGAKIRLHTASVGATENLMLAAVKAKGETIIENAAREPEITDLAKFLVGMGAKVTGAGTNSISVVGVDKLHTGKPHCTMPDRIVAGTYLTAAAITGGCIRLHNVCPADLVPVLSVLKEMGCHIHCGKSCITLAAPKRLTAVPHLITEAHPGFPTDMQAQIVAALAIAEGTSTVMETVFESRHAHGIDLNRMGADIKISKDARTFVIKGKEFLHGETVAAQDLRGGAALILAGLAAKGETVVQNAHYVERGYAGIEKDLKSLGADIELETTFPPTWPDELLH